MSKSKNLWKEDLDERRSIKKSHSSEIIIHVEWIGFLTNGCDCKVLKQDQIRWFLKWHWKYYGNCARWICRFWNENESRWMMTSEFGNFISSLPKLQLSNKKTIAVTRACQVQNMKHHRYWLSHSVCLNI